MDEIHQVLLGKLPPIGSMSCGPTDNWVQVEQAIEKAVEKFMPETRPLTELKYGGVQFLVCLDEARNFLNVKPTESCSDMLTQLNRASRLLPVGGVFVFMDTLSDINILKRHPFPSDRTIHVGAKQFVYTNVAPYDIGIESAHAAHVGKTLSTSFLSCFGRPRWWAMNCAGFKSSAIHNAALFKLQGSPNSYSKGSAIDENLAVALLACRTSFDANLAFKLRVDLIGSYLAHVDWNANVEEPMIAYPSDPILSEAARSIMTNRVWNEVVGRILRNCNSKMMSIGHLGELVGQIVCVYAMDRALESRGSKVLPTVCEFLQKLTGIKFDEERYKDICDGVVNFNHFIQTHGYSPNRGDLVTFMKRRAAVVCKPNERGVDLIIPVVLPSKYGSSKDAHKIQLKYDASKWTKRPVDPGESSSVLSKELEMRIKHSIASIKEIEPDTLHTFAPLSGSSPTLSSSSTSSSTEMYIDPPSSSSLPPSASVLPAKHLRSCSQTDSNREARI